MDAPQLPFLFDIHDYVTEPLTSPSVFSVSSAMVGEDPTSSRGMLHGISHYHSFSRPTSSGSIHRNPFVLNPLDSEVFSNASDCHLTQELGNIEVNQHIIPMQRSGASGYQFMTIKSHQGHNIQIPVDIQASSRLAEEKRIRNAGASAQFRARRKEKQREASSTIRNLQQQLRDAGEDIDYYRSERNFFRSAYQQPGADQMYGGTRPPSPRLRRGPSDFNPPPSTSVRRAFSSYSGYSETAERTTFPGYPEYSNHAQKVPSCASSAASIQSHRGRSHARPSSILSRASSSYSELVFEANPGRSSSRNSAVSGRRGPLDKVAKATMNAVKKVGSCWRCKILRENCDPKTPCLTCPKGGQNSQWRDVGCRRGPLKVEISSSVLCPAEADNSFFKYSIYQDQLDFNTSMREETQKRDEELRSYPNTDYLRSHGFYEFYDKLREQLCQSASESSIDGQSPSTPPPASLQPLKECILGIFWELRRTPSSNDIFQLSKTTAFVARALTFTINLQQICRLLYPAARYQASNEADQLIAQSLICLRTSLEVLRLYSHDSQKNIHQNCKISSGCGIHCISELILHLETYSKELSRVLFLKRNLRSMDWWLSAFYSLCIQSLVRKALGKIVGDGNNNIRVITRAAVDEYLYLPVRLFVARSGSYDPLSTDGNSHNLEQDPVRLHHYQTIREELGASVWSVLGINNSAALLQEIFEDKLDELQAAGTSGHTVSNPPLSTPWTVPSTDFSISSTFSQGLPASQSNNTPSDLENWSENQPLAAASGLSRPSTPMPSNHLFEQEFLGHPIATLDTASTPFINPELAEEKKNNLAMLYTRFKQEMWQNIASEMNMHWTTVEEMAWELGEMSIKARADMQQQTQVTQFTNTAEPCLPDAEDFPCPRESRKRTRS